MGKNRKNRRLEGNLEAGVKMTPFYVFFAASRPCCLGGAPGRRRCLENRPSALPNGLKIYFFVKSTRSKKVILSRATIRKNK